MAALNIQRGRDHALPNYNEWRRYCKLPVAETFDDLKQEISSQSLREKLQQLYGHPSILIKLNITFDEIFSFISFSFPTGNIDVWVGCMAEDLIEGGKVGPTFRCLVSFKIMKHISSYNVNF